MTNLAYYYVERSLQEYSMLRHAPSLVAASGLFLALKALAPARTVVWVRPVLLSLCFVMRSICVFLHASYQSM
jgi:hypothetical protein